MNKPAPFTKNQHAFMLRCFNSWFNVAEGGKRGGKNVLTTLAFCILLENHPNRIHLVAGVSIATAKLNILDCDGYGLLNYYEGRCREGLYNNRDCLYVNTRTGEKIVLVSGGGKDGDEKLIKGNTYGMAYVTEANECAEKFLKEVFDRTLSSGNRKVFHDLNPKAEAHWYYQDILNFHTQAQAMNPQYGYNYGHFTIADNMSLSDEKVKEALNTYDKKSVWYQRDMLGLRTAAEGLIYPMFSDTENTYDDSIRPPELEALSRRYCAVDYGTENPCVFLDIYDDGNAIWIDREYYYDGRHEGKPKTDEQYADDFDTFFEKRPPLAKIIIDPSAASFKTLLNNRGHNVIDADNDVSNGIRRMATMLYRRKVKINKRCANFIKELHAYSWDDKARQRGEEKPIKESDHACDCCRYFLETVLPKWRVTGE
jgi:PBSX family phage terminase large subunit